MKTPRTGWLVSTSVAIAVVAASCGGGGGGSNATDQPGTGAETATSAAESNQEETGGAGTTLPAGAQPGLDDYNDDGNPEPTCGTRDFKAGLVLRIACEDLSGYANELAEGTTLVPDSLYGLPGIPDDLKDDVLSGVSAAAIRGRDPEGRQVYVFFLYSDTIFEVGSADLSAPARETLDSMAANLQRRFPQAQIQVRGHTDATGSAASNQTLSERRASNVAGYLASRGIDRSRLSSVGLGPTLPIVLEKNPDGSDNPAGRRENRRVELVVRVP